MRYSWRRYWSRWDREPAALSSGFLANLDGSDWWSAALGYQTLEQLADIQCLVLVGEPGIGKSDAVQQEHQRLSARGHRVSVCDLKEYSTPDEIEARAFGGPFSDGSPTMVFLDSLDEGRTAIKNLLAPLQRIFRERLVDVRIRQALRLRITCRSQEWPTQLGEELRDIFGEENVGFWHMCPLQQSDARAAATANGLNADDFLAQVTTARAEPLAAKPVTLDFLLRIAKLEGQIPSHQSDVYRKGLAALCLDPNKWRMAEAQEGHAGRRSTKERLAIARRIACLSIVCQRPFILSQEIGDTSEHGCLSLPEICAEPVHELIDGEDLIIGIRDVIEVLGCGLFRGAGQGRVTWAHLTYGEFLAADYFVMHGISHEQIENILHSPGEGRIAPPMREVAAWLASLDAPYGRALLGENPDVLIRSDVAVSDDNLRLRLAENYLHQIECRNLDGERGVSLLGRLAGSGLGNVLRPYLVKSERSKEARQTAIEIAGACKCHEVEAELVALALDRSEPVFMRSLAVRQVMRINVDAKQTLLPLLGEADDTLRGATIELLWPGTISTSEMLRAVKPPTTQVVGFYNVFLRDGLIAHLADADLPITLEWMRSVIQAYPDPSYDFTMGSSTSGWDRFSDLATLCQKLYQAGVEKSYDQQVFSALVVLADALLSNDRWRHYPTVRNGNYRIAWGDDDTRRAFCHALVLRRSHQPHLVYELQEFAGLGSRDIDWLVSWLDAEDDPVLQSALAGLCFYTIDRTDDAQYETIYAAALRHKAFDPYRQALEPFTPLDAPYIGYLRQEHARKLAPAGPTDGKSLSVEDIRLQASQWLLVLEQTDPARWWKLAAFLASGPEHDLMNVYSETMGSWWGWQRLTIEDQTRVAEAAWRYINCADVPLAEWWLDPSRNDYRAIFGCLALDYFYETDPARVSSLSASIWERWAPALLKFSANNPEIIARGLQLIKLCYTASPSMTTVRLRERLQSLTTDSHHHVEFGEVLRGLWDATIAEAVADAIARSDLDDASFHEGFRLLFEHQEPVALAWVQGAVAGSCEDDRRPIVLAAALLQDRGRRWHELWPILVEDPSLCRKVLTWAVDNNFLTNMTALVPRDWAAIYLCLHESEPPLVMGAHWVSPRSWPPMFLRSIIDHLTSMGSEDACNALGEILSNRPQVDWISTAILRCRENLRRRVWQAPSPVDLLRVLESSANRLIRNGNDLSQVLMASFGRYRRQLLLEDLWNTRPNCTPKSEKQLSNHLIHHLRNDLGRRTVIANREVEIETLGRGADGERVDILVEAFVHNQRQDTVKVVIEVKGCWNKDLLTSMETQLAGGYLAHTGISQGIYYVGWFLCSAWAGPDKGRLAMAESWALTVDDARAKLDNNASELCCAGRNIRAFVLDVRWPGQGQRQQHRRQPKRKSPTVRVL